MLMNMKELLAVANEHNFAIPAFNIGTGQMLTGIIAECEAQKSPVILAIHPSELKFQGDAFIQQVIKAANDTKIPCVIHLDHSGLKEIERAIRDGFTSVMIDASHESFEDNVAITKRVVELAHPLGVSVEAELGTIGSTDNDTEVAGGATNIIYTKPEEAVKFVEETNCDCLAIAIGTAHGLYPKGFKPELKLELLKEIKKVVNVPLVLHGGSGNPDKEIGEAAKLGINKINISSDIKDALYQKLRVVLANDPKVREPFELYPEALEAMREVARHKIKLFGSDDKVKYYTL